MKAVAAFKLFRSWSLFLSLILLCVCSVVAQSGRKSLKGPSAPPAVLAPPTPTPEPQADRDRPQVAVVRGEQYQCTDDGSLVVVHSGDAVMALAPGEVTTKAVIRSKPRPEYTHEARRRAVEGVVTLRAVLAANGKVSTITILKGLPFGLNESALRAACKIEFTPATKQGQAVSQWFKTDFTFRLESSLSRP